MTGPGAELPIEMGSGTEAQRRARLLADLAAEGAARCGYAISVEGWVTGRCDCKYLTPYMPGSTEQTGCCELRAAYRVIQGKQPIEERPRHSTRRPSPFPRW